jgi:hypothetical protein
LSLADSIGSRKESIKHHWKIRAGQSPSEHEARSPEPSASDSRNALT